MFNEIKTASRIELSGLGAAAALSTTARYASGTHEPRVHFPAAFPHLPVGHRLVHAVKYQLSCSCHRIGVLLVMS